MTHFLAFVLPALVTYSFVSLAEIMLAPPDDNRMLEMLSVETPQELLEHEPATVFCSKRIAALPNERLCANIG